MKHDDIFTFTCNTCGKPLVIVPSHTGYGEYFRARVSECQCDPAVVSLIVMQPKRLGVITSG